MKSTITSNRFSLSVGVMSLFLIAVACGSANIALAQAPGPGSSAPGTPGYTLTFDEAGNSLLNGGPNPLPVVPIPGGGIEFFLPGPVVPGDVLVRGLSDISAVNNGVSDLLSFSNNTANQGILSYFSLIDDSSPPDLADVSAFNLNTPFGVTEFGPEGLNKFQWIPDPNNVFSPVYNGVSDGLVPEPSTFIMGGLGLIALFLICRRRRSAA
ncbi:MAG TPA: PEP-CTERM sorting domain-containing protein [Pirellulales bacterium]|jgi:hypothetical protein|nr:PEP-CTERM sorting domain-containing protein [Pirellulales bacterium]